MVIHYKVICYTYISKLESDIIHFNPKALFPELFV